MSVLKKSRSSKVSTQSSNSCSANLVYMNDGIRICAEACACCWDKPIPDSYEDKVTYLGKRSKMGHTSVLEHSNIVILLKLPFINKLNTYDTISMLDLLSACKYLNIRYNVDKDDGYILIGGSYRAFDSMYKLSKDPLNNKYIKSISSVLYDNTNSEIFYDLTRDNILIEDYFLNVVPDPLLRYFNPISDTPLYETDKIKVISADNIDIIKENIKILTGIDNLFTTKDIEHVCGLTILFKNMSRTATHQLVRHRNAITQESQRYVDYSSAAFANPYEFKPDKYDSNKVYDIEFGNTKYHMTSNAIGNSIINIYQNMLKEGMLKEDARAFLPSNVKCRKLYMTFTYASFNKFLELRTSPSAQAEIRSFALDCLDASKKIIVPLEQAVKDLDSSVDEIMSDKEVILENIINNSEDFKENIVKENN